ncbi:MAG: bifunctional nuclease family protein, partial [Acidobacteria bacterium]|nr:bifunctional nuclease family protein [Acidobacteriota bacterium]
DLLRNIVAQMGGIISRIIVTELRDNTFYALIEVALDDKTVLLDARPSDAIALALRADCPIFVRDEVILASRSNQTEAEENEALEDEEVEWPEELGDIGEYKM